MTEGIALPKWDHLNWWPIWMIKKLLIKAKENTIKTRKKVKLKHRSIRGGPKS